MNLYAQTLRQINKYFCVLGEGFVFNFFSQLVSLGSSFFLAFLVGGLVQKLFFLDFLSLLFVKKKRQLKQNFRYINGGVNTTSGAMNSVLAQLKQEERVELTNVAELDVDTSRYL